MVGVVKERGKKSNGAGLKMESYRVSISGRRLLDKHLFFIHPISFEINKTLLTISRGLPEVLGEGIY
jgi:hypothetical protein